MTIGTAIAAIGLFLAIVGGFVATVRAVGRVELKLDLLWDWYVESHPAGDHRYGRRSYDLAPAAADDRGGPGHRGDG